MSSTTAGGGQGLTSPFSNKPIFRDIPLIRGYNPRPPERARHLIMGLRKSAKSTFVCSLPMCCVLDWEGGCDAITKARAHVVSLTDFPSPERANVMKSWFSLGVWDRYEKIKDALLKDAKTTAPTFTTIAVDSVDYMFDVICARFCQENNIFSVGDFKGKKGTGWYQVRVRLLSEIDAFEQAGYGLLLTTHQTETTVWRDDHPTLQLRPNLSEQVRQALLRRVDQIVHMSALLEQDETEVTTMVKGKPISTTQRTGLVTRVRLRTVPVRDDKERGCRVNIPDKLLIPEVNGWDTYAAAYRAEVERRRAAESQATAETKESPRCE